MKLKYYMRGLGLGIILTTLIFFVSGTKEKLSDKEIMEQAKALGMVTVEESNQKLEQLLSDIKPTGLEETVITPMVEPTAIPTESAATPTVAPTPEPTPEPTPVPTKQPEKTVDESPTDDAQDTETRNNIDFTIKRGMTSGHVAALLVEVGLIEDADDFNKYIVDKGKASIIRVGEYSLPEGSSYDKIITKITSP